MRYLSWKHKQAIRSLIAFALQNPDEKCIILCNSMSAVVTHIVPFIKQECPEFQFDSQTFDFQFNGVVIPVRYDHGWAILNSGTHDAYCLIFPYKKTVEPAEKICGKPYWYGEYK